MKYNIVVCCGGNAGHAICGLLGSNKDLSVSILTRKPEFWNSQIDVYHKYYLNDKDSVSHGCIEKISSDPSVLIPGADIIIIATPMHACCSILSKISPYLKPGCIIGSIFSQGGFDWMVNKLVSKTNEVNYVFGLQNIPWICKTQQYGKSVALLGIKKYLLVASCPSSKITQAKDLVEYLFRIPSKACHNFLSLTLTPSNQLIHPARYYGIFNEWDGISPIPHNKIQWNLYSGMDEVSVSCMEKLDNELQAIRKKITTLYPNCDLSYVEPIKQRLINQYGDSIEDSSSLLSIFRTNKSYYGCVTPVEIVIPDQLYKPAVNCRFFWEDIPYGLCILSSIAKMVEVETPTMDSLIRWHQKLMGKEYLLANGQFNTQLYNEMGIPEVYGLKTIDDIINFTQS